MMQTNQRPYRVYPSNERARTFASLERARDFATAAYMRQVITDMSPVTVVTGTASNYQTVGQYGLRGWEWAEDIYQCR